MQLGIIWGLYFWQRMAEKIENLNLVKNHSYEEEATCPACVCSFSWAFPNPSPYGSDYGSIPDTFPWILTTTKNKLRYSICLFKMDSVAETKICSQAIPKSVLQCLDSFCYLTSLINILKNINPSTGSGKNLYLIGPFGISLLRVHSSRFFSHLLDPCKDLIWKSKISITHLGHFFPFDHLCDGNKTNDLF